MIILSIPPPSEGRIAIVTDVRRRGAMDVRRLSAGVAPTKASSRTAKSYGPDLPTLRSTPGSRDVGLAADTPRARGDGG